MFSVCMFMSKLLSVLVLVATIYGFRVMNRQFVHISHLFQQSNVTTSVESPTIPSTEGRIEKPIVERKPIADLKRSLYQRFALPIAQYIQSVEAELPTTTLRNTFRQHLLNRESLSYPSLGVRSGFRHIDIDDVYKSILMLIPEDESILSVNGYLAYYPSTLKLDSSQNTIQFATRESFTVDYEQFTILIETERFVYECKPSMTFRYTDDRSRMEVYANGYHDRMDKHQRFLNNGYRNTCGYLCLQNIRAGTYYRIHDTQIPYCIERYPKKDGIELKTVIRIHPLEFDANITDFDTVLQKDYEELMEIRKKAGICIPKTVVVYDD